ncbi:Fe-S protein assembly co-chaperone HscB [Chitinimonas arctica]|uniref:Co-chaperone protein HscB homolog n=1 Tax=Chitinimonas arctica TaxID=2594795 RepID=A0A516SC80_9NEIS|nr:Fe-S protein assembly co-chaperone HscB [Chitinimonas arctica]QDQ25759.1 Fe-S protein assembly co-chaperone HscB [Chitinimonas arctica]
MVFDFSQDHFALFGLPRGFRLDRAALDAAYLGLQSRYHPDRAAGLGDADKRLSLQAATRVNEAFQTLKSPLGRARYLLQLAGVDTQEETNTSMPTAFLMQQMEWREAVADARADKQVAALEKLAGELRGETRLLEAALSEALDARQDHAEAALLVRKLKFLEKLAREIDDATELLLDQ